MKYVSDNNLSRFLTGLENWTAGSDSNLVHRTGDEAVAGIKTYSSSPLVPDPADDSSQQAAPAVWVRDTLRSNVEAATNGRNTIVYDRFGQPHVMVVVPKFLLSDIDASWAAAPHPAFIVGGVEKSEILIGKYLAGKSSGNHVLTLPRQAPWASINFDNSLAACRELGTGFCLNTNAMWSARALWDYKTLGGSHEYLGNSNFGRSHSKKWLTGVMQSGSYTPGDTSVANAATLTGSGGLLWNDDETESGIADMTGNVWEWVGGLRLDGGEIQIIPDNNASLATSDMAASSTEWKAILQDGSLVAPGTADTLKYDGSVADIMTGWADAGTFRVNTQLVNQNDKGYYSISCKDLTAYSGVTIPAVMTQMGLFPIGNDVQGRMWVYNKGESLPYRGGGWANGSGECGPFAMYCTALRSYSARNIGFRVAFVAS